MTVKRTNSTSLTVVSMPIGKTASLRHSCSISLVLNLETELTSPQYHLKFNDLFETVQEINKTVEYKWQKLCSFTGLTKNLKCKCNSINKPPETTQPRPSTHPPEKVTNHT
mmetsp:Transcript_40512/g.57015  ORF Transcript_40512/g.57015 Transcript_40512/m.57015 type:complete len:111 (+) Transcript_40512:64-396(+)